MQAPLGIGSILGKGIDVAGAVFGAKVAASSDRALAAQSASNLQTQREFALLSSKERNTQLVILGGLVLAGLIAYKRLS